MSLLKTGIGLGLATGVTLVAWAGSGVAAPQSTASPLPEGPGKTLVERACSNCHELAVVVAHRRTAEDWNEEINKMVDRGAVVSDAEQDQIVAYFAKNYGKPAGGK